MLNADRMLTAWLPIEEVVLDGGGGSPLAPEGIVKDFVTKQLLGILLSKLDDIKKAIASGDTSVVKDVAAMVAAKIKEYTGVAVTEEQIVQLIEFIFAMISVKDDLPKALKEFGDVLIAGAAFLAGKPLIATIVRQAGEMLIAVAAELGKKTPLVGSPDDRLGSAIEDFDDLFPVVGAGAEPDADIGIIGILTIGRVIWEIGSWWWRRRQERKAA